MSDISQRLDSIERSIAEIRAKLETLLLALDLSHSSTPRNPLSTRTESKSVEAQQAELINWLLRVIVFVIPGIVILIAILSCCLGTEAPR